MGPRRVQFVPFTRHLTVLIVPSTFVILILCRSGTQKDFGEKEALLTELYSEKGLPQERAVAAAQKDRQAAISLRQVACKTMADKALNIPKTRREEAASWMRLSQC